MTPDQLDRLQLAILNMVLMDDGDDPITLAQLQAENAADPAATAEQRAKVAKLVSVIMQVLMPPDLDFLTAEQFRGLCNSDSPGEK